MNQLFISNCSVKLRQQGDCLAAFDVVQLGFIHWELPVANIATLISTRTHTYTITKFIYNINTGICNCILYDLSWSKRRGVLISAKTAILFTSNSRPRRWLWNHHCWHLHHDMNHKNSYPWSNRICCLFTTKMVTLFTVFHPVSRGSDPVSPWTRVPFTKVIGVSSS